MQFTKVHQELAKPVYEAIKKIAERQEKECPKCRGLGKFPLSKERIVAAPRYTHIKCPKCNGTGKVKGKWEWEPEPRELFALPDYEYNPHHLGIYLYTSDNFVYYYFLPGKKIVTTQIGYFEYCIPLLHWEDHLEPILEGFGWVLWDMKRTVPSSDGTGSLVVVELAKGESLKCGRGKDRQEAFQRAVLAVAEKRKAREGA